MKKLSVVLLCSVFHGAAFSSSSPVRGLGESWLLVNGTVSSGTKTACRNDREPHPTPADSDESSDEDSELALLDQAQQALEAAQQKGKRSPTPVVAATVAAQRRSSTGSLHQRNQDGTRSDTPDPRLNQKQEVKFQFTPPAARAVPSEPKGSQNGVAPSGAQVGSLQAEGLSQGEQGPTDPMDGVLEAQNNPAWVSLFGFRVNQKGVMADVAYVLNMLRLGARGMWAALEIFFDAPEEA